MNQDSQTCSHHMCVASLSQSLNSSRTSRLRGPLLTTMTLPGPLQTVLDSLLNSQTSGAAVGAALITPGSRRNNGRVILMALAAAGSVYYLKTMRDEQAKGKRKLLKVKTTMDVDGKKKVAVDAEFFRQLKVLLKICIPSWQSPEVGLLALHTAFLIGRTWLSLIVAELDGQLVRDLIQANLNGFGWGLVKWFAISIPATYTNSMVLAPFHGANTLDSLFTEQIGHCIQNQTYSLRDRLVCGSQHVLQSVALGSSHRRA